MFKWNYESPRRGARLPRAALRRVRRQHRRLGPRGRALHHRAGRASSCGGAAACSAGAPTTGDASPCASARTTSSRRSRDGLGDDWPISYDDLKPYYDKLDELVGLFGSEREPAQRAGRHLPAAADAALPRAPRQEGLRPAAGSPASPRASRSSRSPTTAARPATTAASAAAGAAPTRTSRRPRVLLPPALKTGRLKIVTGAMAREVTTDTEGLATGVSYIDTSDRPRVPGAAPRSWCWPRAPASRRASS